MELTNENYHSTEARKEYCGSSQFKSFLKCEKEALAEINGEVEEKSTTALLFGSYVDAYFSGELDDFTSKHPEIFNSKTGELKSDYKSVNTVIKAVEDDPLMMEYLSGQHQVIMTGIIAGEKYKIKIDSYLPGKAIVDQKCMKDFEPVWTEVKDENGNIKNVRVNFVDAYRYDIQAAIYQIIVYQNTGEKLPFILAGVTKEEVPAKALLEIDQEDIDAALQEVIDLTPRIGELKRGSVEPVGCGRCNVCHTNMKCTEVQSYHVYDPYKKDENEVEF